MRFLSSLLSGICFVWSISTVIPDYASAENIVAQWVCKIVSMQGKAFVKRAGGDDWEPVRLDDLLFPGDALRLLSDSRAALMLSNESLLRVDQHTTLVFTGIERRKTFLMELLEGAAYFFSRKTRSLKVATPFVNGVVEGTEFYVRVDADKAAIILYEGAVLAQNRFGEMSMAKGQAVVAEAGRAPDLQIVAQPRDAVQWALYYPPTVAFRSDDFPIQEADDWTTRLHHSIRFFEKGELPQAFAAIDALYNTVDDPRFYVFRACLELSVGRVTAATRDVEQALRLGPDNSNALALQAVMAVVANNQEKALMDARHAVSLDPRSAAAHIALSYAMQAGFDLPSALASAAAATTSEPENGIAWARLAELHLSTGHLDQALSAARKAATLSPQSAHAATVLGYAYLTQIKIEKAQESFEQSIVLDSAAPLPRLGLGLAMIRQGHLHEGRAEIEIAVGLDPDNALLRSYLGKAYFEEKRDGLDERQFEIAKQLDPNDPTPWFYDAIRKQTLNRPGEALQDLQKAIELNDYRAVYRSRLMLDEDLAARSASLSRIYSALDFEELAIREGIHSLEADATNYSAHRLLSDAYASRPRHEIARVSELLQSQLLQPINISPLQPQLSETNLFVLTGAQPVEPSWNEFNSLFLRNRVAAQANLAVGSKGTFGDDIVVSAVQNNLSLSVGQYYYETDGFRENNDLRHEIYNAFTQIGLTHRTSIQAEARYRDTQRGDPYLRFDPENYLSTVRRPQRVGSGRIGFHHQFSLGSDLIGSWIYSDLDGDYIHPLFIEVEGKDKGYISEVEHLFRGKRLRLTSGAGYLNADRKNIYSFADSPEFNFTDQYTIEHLFGYVYFYTNWPHDVSWTLGLSGSQFRGQFESNQLNPKIGLSWKPVPRSTLRAAAFRVLESTYIAKQRLEPTHVSGFNQFFEAILDGGEAVDAWNYGIGFDQKVTEKLSAGVEYVKRELVLPYLSDFGTNEEADWEENNLRLYVFMTPLNWISISTVYHYEFSERAAEYPGEEQFVELDTHRLAIGARFFFPQGLYAGAKATYVHQKGEFGNVDEIAPDQDNFWVIDADIGYLLPRRLGSISIEGKNLLNEDFRFQDTDPARASIYPDQYILVKLTLSL